MNNSSLSRHRRNFLKAVTGFQYFIGLKLSIILKNNFIISFKKNAFEKSMLFVNIRLLPMAYFNFRKDSDNSFDILPYNLVVFYNKKSADTGMKWISGKNPKWNNITDTKWKQNTSNTVKVIPKLKNRWTRPVRINNMWTLENF